jgi:hypothetical protein
MLVSEPALIANDNCMSDVAPTYLLKHVEFRPECVLKSFARVPVWSRTRIHLANDMEKTFYRTNSHENEANRINLSPPSG